MTSEIVIWVIVVLGFVMVLYFLLFGLDLGGMSDDELCKLSILTRASAPTEAQGIVPLNCNTKKICLTGKDGGKCEKEFAGEKNVKIIKLPNDDAKATKQIEEETANAFYDCWKMSGKGRLDLFGGYAVSRGLDNKLPVCIICSRVAIDDKYRTKHAKVIEMVDVHGYIDKTIIPKQKITYSEAFAPNQRFGSYANTEVINALSGKGDKLKDIEVRGLNEPGTAITQTLGTGTPKDVNEIAIIFSQIRPQNFGDAWTNVHKDILGISAGVGFLMPATVYAAGKWVFKAAGAKIIFGLALATEVAGSLYIAHNVYEGKQVAAGYCGEFVSNVDKTKVSNEGCSLISTMPYDADFINKLCPQIEGWP